VNILDHLPAFRKADTIRLPDGTYYTVRPAQVVVTVCLRIGESLTRAFPAFLDPGNNFNFYLSETHLREWLHIDPLTIEKIGEMRVNGQPTILRKADVVLFQNQPGTHATSGKTYEFLFSTSGGIAVDPQPPRHLPILGIRGIFMQNLNLVYEGKRIAVSLTG
jgi:hypothetical protein